MTSKIKIVLVDSYPGVLPGLGLGYLAGALRQEFREEEIEIKILQRKFEKNLLTSILAEKSDIVGYISFTPGMNYLVDLIKAVAAKNPSAIQIMGGPHITAMPQDLLPEVRVGAIGPGEKTICYLARIFQQKNDLPAEDLRRVPGIVFRDNGELVITGRADFYENFDEVPKPARDLLNIKGFFPLVKGPFPLKFYRSSGVMTSRGCPFNCIFCQEDVFNKYRHHGAERAVAEIEELIEKYQVNFIEIMDDQFAIDLKRLEEIVIGIEKKQLNRKAIFFCYLRADQVSDAVLLLLKRMNVKIIFIGFESGSDKILKYLKQPHCSVATNQRAYNLCRQHGLAVYGSFIFGSPPETLADMEMTLDFIKKNKMALTEVQTLTPLPGTRIWDYAKEKGLVSDKMNWDSLLLRIRGDGKDQPWLGENVSYDEFYKFYKTKVEPVTWHYKQIIKDFNLFDLLKPDFWRFFRRQPKNYLSMFKHTVADFFPQKFQLPAPKASLSDAGGPARRNLRVLLLTQMYSNQEMSGGVRTTWNYSQELAKQGVRVFVLANNINVDQLPRHPNLKVYRVPFSRYGHEIVKDDALKSFLFALPIILWHRIDVVHVVPVQGISPFSRFKFGAKFVEDFEITWDYNDPKYKNDLWRDRKRKSNKFGEFNFGQKIFFRLSNVFYKLFKLNEEYARGTDAYFCRSFTIMDYLRQRGIKKKLYYVPIGVNLAEFNPNIEPLLNKDHKFIFLFSSYFAYRKGVSYLIKAYQQLVKKYPDRSELWLMGGADELTTAELKQLADNEPSIKFIDAVKPNLVGSYLATGDVYVAPPLITEYGPIQPNALEAMAMNKPVIISEYGDTRCLSEKEVALTCQAADVDSLFVAMERLFLNSDLRKKLAINGGQYMKDHYSWEVVVGNAIGYYHQLCNTK